EWTSALYRVHRLVHGPVWFGRGAENRFDDPRGEYGVLYASEDLEGAYLETVRLEAQPGKPLPIGPTEGWLFARGWSRLTVKRPLRLVDLAAQQKKLRIGGEVMSGPDYETSRAWSRAFFEHPDRADGLLYRARHGQDRLSIALFARGETLLDLGLTVRFEEDLDRTLDLLEACDHLPVPDDDR
ncbi:MAG: RES family NAD+ phosphorylase, partial [Myxococcota bacterium]